MQQTLATMALLIIVGCSKPINVEEIENLYKGEHYRVHFAALEVNINAC